MCVLLLCGDLGMTENKVEDKVLERQDQSEA